MNVIVCIKQVPDPEVPPVKFKIDPDAKKVVPPVGVAPVISMFDERAVEAACRLKDKYKAKIIAITLGQGKASDVVKHAFAMGADEGYQLADPSFENLDSFGTAYILSQAIRKIGAYDLVLCGRQAADWDSGQVGSILAEYLGIPAVTLASDIQVANGKATIKRVQEDGYEVVEATLPSLVTVSSELGIARLPSGINLVMSARKKIPVWTAADIQTDPAQYTPAAAHTQVSSLTIPVREANCQMIAGETPGVAGANLALKLRELNVI